MLAQAACGVQGHRDRAVLGRLGPQVSVDRFWSCPMHSVARHSEHSGSDPCSRQCWLCFHSLLFISPRAWVVLLLLRSLAVTASGAVFSWGEGKHGRWGAYLFVPSVVRAGVAASLAAGRPLIPVLPDSVVLLVCVFPIVPSDAMMVRVWRMMSLLRSHVPFTVSCHCGLVLHFL